MRAIRHSPRASLVNRRNPIPWWTVSSFAIGAAVLLPVLGLASQAIRPSDGLWTHLIAYVLPDALYQTLVLLSGVAIVSGCIGTVTAWLVTAYDFPGRRILEWALLLPLAVPTYIIAYAYLDILHPIGGFQTVLRALLGFESPRDFRLPDIRSMPGCILLLGFVLYPYVYLTSRAMFLTQSANMLDAARTLGVSGRGLFWRIALPLARPAIAVGVSLTLMEALNDVGAAEFLGVRTLTVSIYSTWITRLDLAGASQIALFLLLLVVGLVSLERWARRKQRYSVGTQRPHPPAPRLVEGWRGVALFLAGMVPVMIGFIIPFIYLVTEAFKRWKFAGLSDRLISEAGYTLMFAALATCIAIALGTVVAAACRFHPGSATRWASRLATMGYAAPGTVIAVGCLVTLTAFDRFIDSNARQWFGVTTGLLMMGSGAALIYAYVVRFLTISVGSIDAGMARIPASLDHAARSLGRTSGRTLWEIHMPLSRTAIGAGGLLVFVDCVKELPATLLLRPLNVETFATHLYGEAARGTYEEASLAALAIVAIGILPVIAISRVGRQSR